jgi:hypothetical protein
MGQEEAMQQMLQTFQHLAPLLHVDKGLTLEPNPAAPKKQRKHQDVEPNGHGLAKGQSQGATLDHNQILLMMGRLLLRVDRDLQVLQRETTFIFYFSCKDPKGFYLSCCRRRISGIPKPRRDHHPRRALSDRSSCRR